MTRLQLKNLLLYWVDDLNAGYFTDTQVNVWLNNAQRIVQSKLIQANSTYYVQTVQTSTVVNQFDYLFPSDFLALNRLEIILSGTGVNEIKRRLVPVTLNQQDLVSPPQSGAPTNYAIKKDRFSVFPAPDSTSYYLRLYYSPVVSDMASDAAVPDVPTQYHEYVSVVAALDAFVKDDRVPTNLLEKKLFYEQTIMAMADERKQDESRSVIVTSDDNWGTMF